MVKHQVSSTPSLSIVIPVFNDWDHLGHCLKTLAQQANAPSFEVIVVDDGSDSPMNVQLLKWGDCYPLTVVRQPHEGISSARNMGLRVSKAPTLVFVDADCRLQANCLRALDACVMNCPENASFQLRLIGDCSTLSGRTEELRLSTLQSHFVQPDRSIRYLNTAGFAIRRSKLDLEKELFDTSVFRGEDTLLLVNLMQSGEPPLFAAEAVVQHIVPPTLTGMLRKRVRSAYLEAKAYERIAASGFKIRVSHRERLRMLRSMWKMAGHRSIQRLPWFVLVLSQALQRTISVVHSCLTPYPGYRKERTSY
jgi:glycosyltransferase involved in cell wall biosynthesis